MAKFATTVWVFVAAAATPLSGMRGGIELLSDARERLVRAACRPLLLLDCSVFG